MFGPDKKPTNSYDLSSKDKLAGSFNLIFLFLMTVMEWPFILLAHAAWVIYLIVLIFHSNSKSLRFVYGLLIFAIIFYVVYLFITQLN